MGDASSVAGNPVPPGDLPKRFARPIEAAEGRNTKKARDGGCVVRTDHRERVRLQHILFRALDICPGLGDGGVQSGELGEKLEETFTSVVAGAVEMHAEKIGARLNDQNQSRLDLAKETCASLTVLKNEMARITSDMATDVDVKRADVTPSGLARHSILVDYK